MWFVVKTQNVFFLIPPGLHEQHKDERKGDEEERSSNAACRAVKIRVAIAVASRSSTRREENEE